MVAEVAHRGRGSRESGAFLLARTRRRPRRVVDRVLFDDLDPDALNGAISIRGTAFARLWEICAERGLRVVADVHTHPGNGVAQSRIDAANPMIAHRGHLGIILPHFATRAPHPREAGVHVYMGDRTWRSHYGDDAAHRIRLTWW
jgi:proteasome lid subunit RPN8/RPN11